MITSKLLWGNVKDCNTCDKTSVILPATNDCEQQAKRPSLLWKRKSLPFRAAWTLPSITKRVKKWVLSLGHQNPLDFLWRNHPSAYLLVTLLFIMKAKSDSNLKGKRQKKSPNSLSAPNINREGHIQQLIRKQKWKQSFLLRIPASR